MNIRDETPGDESAIHELTKAAFAPVEMSDGREAEIIDGLREDRDLTLSLVAEQDGQIVGHVAFSPVRVSDVDGQWFGLGPISVHPGHQRAGVGRQLIEQGLDRLRSLGADGCVVVGDPVYYKRFGFTSSGELAYGEVPKQYVQAIAFQDKHAKGDVRYSPAFEGY